MRSKASDLFEMVVMTLSILRHRYDPRYSWEDRKPLALCGYEKVYAIEEVGKVSAGLFILKNEIIFVKNKAGHIINLGSFPAVLVLSSERGG